MPDIIAPLKLAIRGRQEEGYILACVMPMDSEEILTEISTINISFAEKDPDGYRLWFNACAEIFRRMMERETGLKATMGKPEAPNRN